MEDRNAKPMQPAGRPTERKPDGPNEKAAAENPEVEGEPASGSLRDQQPSVERPRPSGANEKPKSVPRKPLSDDHPSKRRLAALEADLRAAEAGVRTARANRKRAKDAYFKEVADLRACIMPFVEEARIDAELNQLRPSTAQVYDAVDKLINTGRQELALGILRAKLNEKMASKKE